MTGPPNLKFYLFCKYVCKILRNVKIAEKCKQIAENYVARRIVSVSSPQGRARRRFRLVTNLLHV